jgi:DNA-directed RNA polymerase specialized sigma24 family protein
MKEIKPIYSPEEMDEIAREYRDNGTSESADLLLKAYSGFLWKYTHLFKAISGNNEHINLHRDKELSRFIKLIGSQNTLAIIRLVLQSWTADDIYNEMVILFFETTRKWIEKGDIHFPGFISGYFRYIVKKWLDKITKDALNTIEITNESKDAPIESNEYEITDLKYILYSTSELLKDLTPQERYIVYLQKIKHLNDKEVAKKIGVYRDYVPIVREKALTKIKINYANIFSDTI